ncbi:PIP5KL1, partial [Symbiodinium pilosum]
MLEEGARKDLVFLLLLIAGARSTISSTLMIRFANAFRKVRDDYAVNHTDQAHTGEVEPADYQRFGALQQIAQSQLKRHWKRYRTVGEEKSFRKLRVELPRSRPSRDFKIMQKMKSSASVVEGILGRHGHTLTDLEDITLETESLVCSFEEAATPAERVVTSLPIIIQAVHNVEMALAPLLSAVEDFLGSEPLLQPGEVERCSYEIPAGGCAFCTESPGSVCLPFQAFGVSLLHGMCEGRAGVTPDVLLEELGDPSQPIRVLSTNSKSGEMFFISHTGKFIIKSISDAEGKGLEAILPSYISHLAGEEGSILGLYVGLYRIDMGSGLGQRYFTIMRSVFDSPVQMTKMYDLKGSTHNRKVKDASERVRKDEDWISDKCRLMVSPEDVARLEKMHARDTAFLSEFSIIDFSVLIGIAEIPEPSEIPDHAWQSVDKSQCYFIGIVDVLIEYGLRKRLEHLLHTVKGVGQTASVTDPKNYAKRQRRFFREHVLPGYEGMLLD